MTSSARILLATIGAGAAACLLAACPRGRTTPADPAPTPSAFMLPAAQRGKIHLEVARLTPFRRTVESTATVEFDSDRATQVLAPFSGRSRASSSPSALGSGAVSRWPLPSRRTSPTR